MASEHLNGEWKLAHAKTWNCRAKVPCGKIVHVFSEGDTIEVQHHVGKDWCMLAKPESLEGAYVRLRTTTGTGRAWVQIHQSPATVEQAPPKHEQTAEIPGVSEMVHRHLGNSFMGVLVTMNGSAIHSKVYGSGTSQTKCRLLSVTKQFTAVCAAMLIDEGRLELKAKVSRYLPELNLPVNGRELLIQDLLWHTSGLPDFLYARGSAANKYLNRGSRSNKSHADWLATTQPPAPPGEKFSYTNSGYVLLARVVEVIAGESFHAFQKRRIFDVLEMSGASDNSSFNGSGTLAMTLSDYAKWDLALWRKDVRLLSPSSFQMLFAPGTLDDGQPVHYGFGWMLWDAPKWVHHTGSGGGWKNLVKRYIPESTTVAIFCHNGANDHHALADAILSVVQNLATTHPLQQQKAGATTH